MATITASPDPANGRILLTVTGATVGDTITRDGLPVRYPPLTGSTAVLYDYEAQPGKTHTYAVSSGGTATATIPAGQCDGVTLVHPTDPSLTLKVKLREDSEQRWSAPGTLHEVMGARPPLVTHTVRTYHSGRLVWWTPLAQRQAVVDLFAEGTPILVNPPTCCPSVEYQWAWGELSAEWAGGDVTGASGLWWTLDYTRTVTPSGTVTRPGAIANSWAGVLAEPTEPTWAALKTSHATWAQVVATMHPHGATP